MSALEYRRRVTARAPTFLSFPWRTVLAPLLFCHFVFQELRCWAVQALATPTARLRMRAITPTRSVTEIAPRASSRLNRWEHFRHRSKRARSGKRFPSGGSRFAVSVGDSPLFLLHRRLLQYCKSIQQSLTLGFVEFHVLPQGIDTGGLEVVDRKLQLVGQANVAVGHYRSRVRVSRPDDVIDGIHVLQEGARRSRP